MTNFGGKTVRIGSVALKPAEFQKTPGGILVKSTPLVHSVTSEEVQFLSGMFSDKESQKEISNLLDKLEPKKIIVGDLQQIKPFQSKTGLNFS